MKPPSLTPRLLIWDFDGTLAPSLEQIVISFQAAFAKTLGRHLEPAEVVSLFGPPDEEVIRRRVAPEDFTLAVRTFYETYRMREREASLFSPVQQFLDRTRSSLSHALVTNKGRMTTAIALRARSLEDRFAAVVTGDDVAKPKPDPEGIQRVLTRLSVDPSEAIYLGDSPTDIEAAHRAGVMVAAVAYGGIHSLETLAAHNPTWLIDRPQAIAEWFGSLI